MRTFKFLAPLAVLGLMAAPAMASATKEKPATHKTAKPAKAKKAHKGGKKAAKAATPAETTPAN